MNILDKYLLYEIMYYLRNEYLLNMTIINKQLYKSLKDKKFRSIILKRKHPMVFNIFDNFCKICNFNDIQFYRYNSYINCYHFGESMNPLFLPKSNHN